MPDRSDALNFTRNHLRPRLGPAPSLDAKARALHPASSFSAWKGTYIVRESEARSFFFEEDAHATVLVFGDEQNIQLYVNGKPDASTAKDLDTQLLLAPVPLFLAPDARALLVIGHGSGITAGSALRHPIERADIVEISRAVLHADYVFDYIRWNHLYTVGITYSFHLSSNPQITSTHIGYLAGFIHSTIMH